MHRNPAVNGSLSNTGAQDWSQDLAVDIGEPPFYPVVVEAEALVVESENVQNGGMKIVDGGDVFSCFVAKFIGGAVAEGSLHSCTREPGGKPSGIVVTSAGSRLEGGHASELCAPDYQGVLEQPALLEIRQQRSGGLIQHFAMDGILVLQHLVTIPIARPFPADLVGSV